MDVNCSPVNTPYTPFQQLLCILPTKSITLLPEQYGTLAFGVLNEYFPEEFDIDLNGRALPWEAACLIPFADEHLFIEEETKAMVVMAEEDVKRNKVYFEFKKYKYGGDNLGTLPSPLGKLEALKDNYVTVEVVSEYRNVGQYSFKPELLPGVQWPSIDFPSLKWLGANSVTYDEKVINQVPFQRVLVRVPSCLEDQASEELEAFVYKFAKQASKELYVGYPWQWEAFPTLFEDDKNTYTIFGDVYTNIYKIHKDVQQLDKNKYGMFVARQKLKLQDMGLYVEDCRAFASLNKVQSVQYDNTQNVFYKVFFEQTDLVPLCLVMKRRDPQHYLNVNLRCNSVLQSFRQNEPVICLNMQLFGVMGQVASVDPKRQVVKVEFDKDAEEKKIYDPFFGQICLASNMLMPMEQQTANTRYYNEQQIEQELKMKQGIIGRISSSFLVTFAERKKFDRAVIDLGLNLKNYTKKVHVPDFVRYVAEEDFLASNQYDDY